MKFALGLVAVLATLGIVSVMFNPDTAMKQCMETHSHDTCFQMLNR